jgi:hypothetical protein
MDLVTTKEVIGHIHLSAIFSKVDHGDLGLRLRARKDEDYALQKSSSSPLLEECSLKVLRT